METYTRIQIETYEKFSKNFSNFKKSPKDRVTISYVETRLEQLENSWSQFEEIHLKILTDISQNDYDKSDYRISGTYDRAEEMYTDYKTALKERLRKLKANETLISSVGKALGDRPTNTVKLPKISIPQFSGNYLEWTTFKDLFQSLIHNNGTLTDVEKLRYLKSYLTGEAEQLLRHLPITNDNYVTCWKTLEHRYSNKKLISNCILQRFFNQKNIVTESSTVLKEMFDVTNECINALVNLGVDTKNWDILIIFILSQKLDTESRKLWETKTCSFSNDLPTLIQFLEFLEHRFRSLEFLCNKPVRSTKSHHTVHANPVGDKKYSSCCYCSNQTHKLGNCKDFAKMDTVSRRNFVQSSKLCFNCLGANHSVSDCRLPTRCRVCRKKHHSLLHSNNYQPAETKEPINQSVGNTNVVAIATTSQDETTLDNVTTCFSNTNGQVVLATALVNVEANNGTYITLRSLLDQGSQASFITESAAQLLGLKKINYHCAISGVGDDGNNSCNSKQIVYLKLHSLYDPDFLIEVKAHVLKNLTSVLPERKIMINNWHDLPKLQLADPKFNIPNKINLLLGADVYCQVIKHGLVRYQQGTLLAQNTRFGWILSGKLNNDSTTNSMASHTSIITMHAQVNEDYFNLKEFWELESDKFSLEKKLTLEEIECEKIFKETTKRDVHGRYIVSLPFKTSTPKCKSGNSQEVAIKRLLSLERRFAKSPQLKAEYMEVFSEYQNLGHTEEVPKEEVSNPSVYLPYHEVVRADKSTTKFRVVFNASSKDNNGVSLNSELMVGPTLQSDLRHTLMRWRIHPICLIADIVKMYRQVKVDNSDADYQRLVWRSDPNEPIHHLRLVRLTFGTASAPYLAVRALHQLAYDEGEAFPLASERLLQDYYMDDLITGCKNVAEAKRIITEMTELLNKGGFELQKWASNNKHVMTELSNRNTATANNLDLKKNEMIKILGLTWNRRTDEFQYSVQLPPISFPVTKRKVISDIARLFDPIGWISPSIIKAKIIIQKLWLSGINWDDELPPNLLNEWMTYRDELFELTKFRLPRWIDTQDTTDKVEIHGFSDASNEAYAAAVYCRVINSNNQVCVHLITSKTKVAPTKQVSIPRLELCGALLLAKLLQEVAAVMKIPKDHIYAWTDSTVVLAWLSSHPSRWTTFIANRVSEILNILDRDQWSHVKSAENPADCASRGVSPSQLSAFQLWMSGPVWLQDLIVDRTTKVNLDTDLEAKTKRVYHVKENQEWNIWTKYSSLRKLVRVLAYCRRFINKLKKSHDLNLPTWLTSKELNDALNICIKQGQEVSFYQELKSIRENGIVNKKSKLVSLNPYLDEFNILRIGGRLSRADMNNDTKHPVILPSKCHLSDLIIAEAHSKTLHGGPQLMLNFLRSKYWILNAKNRVKLYVRKCVICVRHTAQTKTQFMGQLPPSRVNPIRPFYRSGVDYAGPIQIRTSKGRGHQAYKGYICLFICMATRAIHLEAVSDLTAQGFLAAFKRFVARRGHCADLYSDNGTNFVGAARELKTLFTQERSTLTMEIAECLATNGTTWHFIPPQAPHFGGLWEAGVKSTKHHLRRVIGNSTLTYEELTTLLYQIEACLNSRPLSQLSPNAQDPVPLTPGHFLIGEPLMLVPDINHESSSISSLSRWQLTQRMLQHFWRRWSREYLTQFYHRYKWAHYSPEPGIGNLVLVKEDGLPPAKWLLGIISEKHKGLDQITRVVTIKCKEGSLKRPITKIVVLPVSH